MSSPSSFLVKNGKNSIKEALGRTYDCEAQSPTYPHIKMSPSDLSVNSSDFQAPGRSFNGQKCTKTRLE